MAMAKLKLTMPKPVLLLMGLRNKPLVNRMPDVIIRMPAAAKVMAITPGDRRVRNIEIFLIICTAQTHSRWLRS